MMSPEQQQQVEHALVKVETLGHGLAQLVQSMATLLAQADKTLQEIRRVLEQSRGGSA
jgi:hypothetical protein